MFIGRLRRRFINRRTGFVHRHAQDLRLCSASYDPTAPYTFYELRRDKTTRQARRIGKQDYPRFSARRKALGPLKLILKGSLQHSLASLWPNTSKIHGQYFKKLVKIFTTFSWWSIGSSSYERVEAALN
jgi:hypothetical protein